MDLGDLVGLRPVPCAGVLMTLTRRCPLRCGHCSTSSTMSAEESDGDDLLRFVRSFAGSHSPQVVMFTGGEPLLRPSLVSELAGAAREAGTRSSVLSGMFFARDGRIPSRVMKAVTAVDHFSASLDVFHEREVHRADVFAAVRQILDAGIPSSFHVVGTGPSDPYLADITTDIRRVFGDRTPVLVNEIRAVGRAAAWASGRGTSLVGPQGVLPCAMAAWPVVAFDGMVVACCNQDVVDRRPAPEHLRLGHVAKDDWGAVRSRALGSPVLRMVRAVGPDHLYERYGTGRTTSASQDFCTRCRALGDHPEVKGAAEQVGAGPAGELLDREAARIQTEAGAAALLRRWGCAPYADLIAPPHPASPGPQGPPTVRRPNPVEVQP